MSFAIPSRMVPMLTWTRICLILTVLSLGQMAVSGPTDNLVYGPEWTFTNAELVISSDPDLKNRYESLPNQEFQKFCESSGKCKMLDDKRTFRFHDGFEIVLSRDPGVLEIQAKPLTLEQWKEKAPIIQEMVFDSMARIGLHPHEMEGAGHLNIGIEYFRNKGLLMRNFIVDFFNHPGVGIVLNSTSSNDDTAGYLDRISATKQGINLQIEGELRKGLEKLDSKESYSATDVLVSLGRPLAYKYLALAIRKAGFKYDLGLQQIQGFPMNARINEDTRFEVRALRPQASVYDFIQVIEIFEARIKYLETKTTPIRLLASRPVTDGWQALGQFIDFLSEVKLNWRKYQSLMLPFWRDLPEEHAIRGTVSERINFVCRKAQSSEIL